MLSLACQPEPAYNFVQQGNASYYANILKGKPTASGQLYHPDSLTAAHRSLPLGTMVLVINPKNKKQIQVTINDRGPFHSKRIIDLSRCAADSLRILHQGTAPVMIKAMLPQTIADSLNRRRAETGKLNIEH